MVESQIRRRQHDSRDDVPIFLAMPDVAKGALLRGVDARLHGAQNVVVRSMASVATRRVGEQAIGALVAPRGVRVTVHAAESGLLYVSPVIEAERE
jgi:hypothetical protein